jgi:hypothetical protein
LISWPLSFEAFLKVRGALPRITIVILHHIIVTRLLGESDNVRGLAIKLQRQQRQAMTPWLRPGTQPPASGPLSFWGDGRCNCELSGSAVHAEEWDTRDQTASENLALRRSNAAKASG